MKYRLFLHVFLLLLGMGCNNKYLDIQGVPNGTVKRIITTHYKPLLHNGEWICGESILTWDYWGDTVYLDNKGRTLLKLDLTEITQFIHDTISGEVRLTENLVKNRRIGSTVKTSYRYNEQGRITKKLINDETEFERIYNEKGRFIEEISKGRKKTVEYPPSTEERLRVVTYKIIDTSKDSPHYKIENAVEIFAKDKNYLCERRIIELFKYNKLSNFQDISYKYDNENRLIEVNTNGKKALIGGIPLDVDRDEYIKKTYFSNPEYEDIVVNEKWEYNSNGDISAYIFYDKTFEENYELFKNSNLNFNIGSSINHSNSKRYEYEYNEKGDWIKKITYPYWSSSHVNSINQLDEPKVITIRDIAYYEDN